MNPKSIITILILISASFCAHAVPDPTVDIYHNHSREKEVSPKEGIDTIKKYQKRSWQTLTGLMFSGEIFSPEKLTALRRHAVYGMGYGGAAGFALRFEYNKRLFIETGLKIGYDYAPVAIRTQGANSTDIQYSRYDLGRGAFQLPMNIGWRFNLTDTQAVGLFAGYRNTYGFAGTLEGSEGLPKYKLYGKEGLWNQYAGAVTIGAIIELVGPFTFSLEGNLGVTQMAKRQMFPTDIMNESDCRVSVTYWIKKRK